MYLTRLLLAEKASVVSTCYGSEVTRDVPAEEMKSSLKVSQLSCHSCPLDFLGFLNYYLFLRRAGSWEFRTIGVTEGKEERLREAVTGRMHTWIAKSARALF